MSLSPSDNDDQLSVIMATAVLPNPPMTNQEKEDELRAAHRLIWAKYSAGESLFTKELFRDVLQQLEQLERNSNLEQKVSVTGLDGLAVHFPIETGKVYPYFSPGDGHVCIVTKPRLDYRTIGDLLAPRDPQHYSVCRAYLPVEVAHSTEIRDAQTNELVSPWPPADYATVKQKFEQTRHSLETGELFAQIKTTLTAESIVLPGGIDKIVALACSSMNWADEECAMPSMAQHALALALRDLLTADGDDARRIKCFAQDPIYTPVDEQVLCEAGFSVVDDPRAFLEIDETSVAISVGPDIPVRQIVADIARPAMMIWTKFEVSDTYNTDPVSPRVIKMMDEYIELPFPDSELFGELAIYVRRSR